MDDVMVCPFFKAGFKITVIYFGGEVHLHCTWHHARDDIMALYDVELHEWQSICIGYKLVLLKVYAFISGNKLEGE
jgi:hypothetical protein